MTDIVERLRSPANVFYEYAADKGAMLREAADEIERLRALLRKAKDRLYDTGCWDEADEIIAALGEKE